GIPVFLRRMVEAVSGREWPERVRPRGNITYKAPSPAVRERAWSHILSELAAGAELAAMHRRGCAAGTGIAVFEPVIGHLLQLLLGAIEGKPIVVSLQIAQLDADALTTHAEKRADIDDGCGDLALHFPNEAIHLAVVHPWGSLGKRPLAPTPPIFNDGATQN